MNSVICTFIARGIFGIIVIAITGIFEANAVQFDMNWLKHRPLDPAHSFTGTTGACILDNLIVLAHETKLHHGAFMTDTSIGTILVHVTVLSLVWMNCVAFAAFILHNVKRFVYSAKKDSLLLSKHRWMVLSFAQKAPIGSHCFYLL